MRYLIDTHILLWYISGCDKLDSAAIEIIDNSENQIFLSQVSLQEMTIKSSLGKLELLVSILDLEFFLVERDILLHPYNYEHLNTLHSLPSHHGDPFDRLIIAQAITDDLIIISDDQCFKNYNVSLYK